MPHFLALIFTIMMTAFPTASWAEGTSCDSWLTKAGKVAALPFQMVKDGFVQFRTELKEEGPIRWLIAPRHEPERFHHGAWLEHSDLPVELASFVRHKLLHRPPLQKKLSRWAGFPVSSASWFGIFAAMASVTADRQVEALDAYLEQGTFGAAYVADWVSSGQLDLGPAVNILAEAGADFKKGLDPLHRRVADFQARGLWTAEQARLAENVISRLIAGHSVAELQNQDKLNETAGADPDFVKLRDSLSEDRQFTLALWLVPEVPVLGKTDTHWLVQLYFPQSREDVDAKEARGLDSILANDRILDHAIPLTTLAQMTAFTLTQTEEIEAKFQEAVKLKLTGDPSYIYRADFPLFQSGQVFFEADRDVAIGGELNLWSLMQTDVRFRGISEQVASGAVSEFQALLEASGRIEELSEVNKVYREDGMNPSTDDFCLLIYGDLAGNSPNAYFSQLQNLGFDPKTVPVQGAFAEATYRSLVEVSLAKDPVEAEAAAARAQVEQDRIVADFKAGAKIQSSFKGCAPAVAPSY